MAGLTTYKDFADNDYQFFTKSYQSGITGNSMGAMAQSICERYMKHIIDVYSEPETDEEEHLKERVLRTHNLQVLSQYLRNDMEIELSDNMENSINSINGYYFSTRYPGSDSIELDERALAQCYKAIVICKEEIESIINTIEEHIYEYDIVDNDKFTKE